MKAHLRARHAEDASASQPAIKRPKIAVATESIGKREAKLPGVYTAILHPKDRETHESNQHYLHNAIHALHDSPEVKQAIADGADFRDIVAKHLESLLSGPGFEHGIYRARDAAAQMGYGRYLLHSEPDPKHKFCIQLFAFSADQKTPIHNHPNECASFILKGELSERLYERIDSQFAEKNAKNPRQVGSWAGFNQDELDIPHSLKNKSGNAAVSVHLYRDMDGLAANEQIAASEKFQRKKTPQPRLAAS